MSRETMSSSNSDQFVIDLEAIHDQQIVRSFNNPSSQVGFMVLRLV